MGRARAYHIYHAIIYLLLVNDKGATHDYHATAASTALK